MPYDQNTYAYGFAEYFLQSPASIVLIDTLEISHGAFTQSYYLTRNARNGITVKIDEGTFEQYFSYMPMKLSKLSENFTLDFGFKVELGDVGETLAKEIDSVKANTGLDEKPIVVYRGYRSDNLDTPIVGPVTLEVDDISFTREGVFFEAKARSGNTSRTGEVYTIKRFPHLKGFL